MKYAKFGPGGNSEAFSAKYRSSIFAPDWVTDMHLDSYEYECGNGVSGSEETFLQIGINAYNHGVSMSVHAPYYISLSGIDPVKRLGSIKYITQSLYAAKCMGASVIVVHAGSASKIDRRDAMSLAADTLRHVVEEYSDMGYEGIKIGLETMGKINQLGTLDEIIELCKIAPCFVPVVDFGHLYARSLGRDIVTSDDIKNVFEKISHNLGASIAENLHCHFSCIEFSNGGEKRHLRFDNGVFGPDPIVFAKTLAELRVTPTVICESAGTQDIDASFLKEQYMRYI